MGETIDISKKNDALKEIVNAANFLLEAMTPGSHVEVRREIVPDIIVPNQKPKYKTIYISVPQICTHFDIRAVDDKNKH